MSLVCRTLLVALTLLLHTLPSFAQIGSVEPFKNGVVSSADYHASKAGIEILKKGGNAVDAAIAVQFTMAVTLPRAGNIGGGGFMMLRLADGTTTALDFREKAPRRAERDMYLDSNGEYDSAKSRRGGLASGIPGTVDGMINALERHGTLPLEVIMEPAIQLAREGYELSYSQAHSLNNAAGRLSEFEGSKATFLKEDGSEWERGELFKQPDLAETLVRIAQQGRRGFYSGVTARLIVDEIRRNDGIITLRDLRDYESVWRNPMQTSFKDFELYMLPPPSSSGFVMRQVLTMLGDIEGEETGFNSTEYIHLLSEAFRRSFADRNYWLGDPDFTEIPLERLTDPGYLQERMQNFDPEQATSSNDVERGIVHDLEESFETTHFNVVDANGNAVAVNTTLNGSFGSYVTVSGAGFLLNNEMDDFSAKPGEPNMFGLTGAEANAIEPGKRMLSSMSPTIAVKDGQIRFLGGAAGGPRIITATLQNFLNMVLFDMNAAQAISAPRFHHQWLPDQLLIEGNNFSPVVRKQLEEMGHNIQVASSLARVHTIFIDEDGNLYGASDPRSFGSVQGY